MAVNMSRHVPRYFLIDIVSPPFPRHWSGHRIFQRPSPQKQIPSSQIPSSPPQRLGLGRQKLNSQPNSSFIRAAILILIKMKYSYILFAFFTSIALVACESEIERNERLTREAQQKVAEEGKKHREKEIYDKYINNSLPTGSTPYFDYYGGNSSCDSYGCSKITIRTSNSDVLVTIKNNDKVVRHSFIKSGGTYTFSMPNGTYQPFFYYGKGWNPEKEMKNGQLKGGFISEEDFGKDDPQTLMNDILTYELILQTNGNFSTRPSNPFEAL